MGSCSLSIAVALGRQPQADSPLSRQPCAVPPHSLDGRSGNSWPCRMRPPLGAQPRPRCRRPTASTACRPGRKASPCRGYDLPRRVVPSCRWRASSSPFLAARLMRSGLQSTRSVDSSHLSARVAGIFAPPHALITAPSRQTACLRIANIAASDQHCFPPLVCGPSVLSLARFFMQTGRYRILGSFDADQAPHVSLLLSARPHQPPLTTAKRREPRCHVPVQTLGVHVGTAEPSTCRR